jgi:hypothetical protein
MTVIEREEALSDIYCWNCSFNLGIPDPTIIRGQEYMKVRERRNVPRFSSRMRLFCLDCFNEGAYWDQKENEE